MTVWLLDVDGVINVATTRTKKPPASAGWDDWVTTSAKHGTRTWPLMAAVPVLEFIRRVHAEGSAEIRWLTTWLDADGVRDIEAVFDLPRLPSAWTGPMDAWALEPGWWKLPIAQRIHAEDPSRRIVWADDEITQRRQAREWVSAWPNVTVVSPNPGMGLMPAHLKRISAVLDTGVWA